MAEWRRTKKTGVAAMFYCIVRQLKKAASKISSCCSWLANVVREFFCPPSKSLREQLDEVLAKAENPPPVHDALAHFRDPTYVATTTTLMDGRDKLPILISARSTPGIVATEFNDFVCADTNNHAFFDLERDAAALLVKGYENYTAKATVQEYTSLERQQAAIQRQPLKPVVEEVADSISAGLSRFVAFLDSAEVARCALGFENPDRTRQHKPQPKRESCPKKQNTF